MVNFCAACIWGLKRTPISPQFLQGARPKSDPLTAILGAGTKPSCLTVFVNSKPDFKFQLWPPQGHQKQKDFQCSTHNSIPISYHLLFCFLQNTRHNCSRCCLGATRSQIFFWQLFLNKFFPFQDHAVCTRRPFAHSVTEEHPSLSRPTHWDLAEY